MEKLFIESVYHVKGILALESVCGLVKGIFQSEPNCSFKF